METPHSSRPRLNLPTLRWLPLVAAGALALGPVACSEEAPPASSGDNSELLIGEFVADLGKTETDDGVVRLELNATLVAFGSANAVQLHGRATNHGERTLEFEGSGCLGCPNVGLGLWNQDGAGCNLMFTPPLCPCGGVGHVEPGGATGTYLDFRVKGCASEGDRLRALAVFGYYFPEEPAEHRTIKVELSFDLP